jgi:hypothetical protein
MKQETMKMAVYITKQKEALESSLSDWERCAKDDVVSPLTFRLGGRIDYMDKEAFEQFRMANISWLKMKISELDHNFASL